MSKFGIGAIALVVAVLFGFSARVGTQTAHAEVDGTVAIGCEFLARYIDGDPDDPTDPPGPGDYTNACNGIDSTDVANLGDALGDEDGTLEASDFEDIDLDGNQLQEDGSNSIYVFAFVDNDGTVTFDAGSGLTVVVNPDDDAVPNVDDLNAETCGATEGLDLDCDTDVNDDGDGVVVATIDVGTADAGDDVDVDVAQADDPSTESTQTISVVGAPDEISVEALKSVVEATGSTSDFDDCLEDSDVGDGTSTITNVNMTILKATVVDNDGVELTRVAVDWDVDDTDVADWDGDGGEDADEPKADTVITVDTGDLAGVGAFLAVCGGTDTGTATFTAHEDESNEEDSVEVTVVGAPAAVALTASPAAIACDGTQTSSVTAKVTDSEGNNVANGSGVEFSVVALGTANPITASTTDGSASSTITPLSGATAGVVVVVTAGDAQASIRIDCSLPIPTATSTGPQPTPTRPGGIVGPDTGNGGYLGQDGSAGFPMWTLVALALGSVALVAGGMVTRKVSK